MESPDVAELLVLGTLRRYGSGDEPLVLDEDIARHAHLDILDVRDLLEILDQGGLIDRVRTNLGMRASITAKGRLVLRRVLSDGQGDEGPRTKNLFLEPFLRQDVTIVLGRFLERFRTFEHSGMVGFGDAVASFELRGSLETLGARSIRVAWASQLAGSRLSGHVIMLGGTSNNELSRRFLGTLRSTFRCGVEDPEETALTDTSTGKKYDSRFDTDTQGRAIDHAVVCFAENPFSPGAKAIYIAGCASGYGTWAGAKHVTSDGFLSNDIVASGKPFECLIETEIFFDSPQIIRQIDIRPLS